MRMGSITTDIIKNGLVFNMDAANRASTIPSTSTTKAFNTIDTSISGSFINDTLYDSSTIPPSFAFDGTTDYIKPNNSSLFQLANFTLSSWVKLSSINSNQYMIDTSSNSGKGFGYAFRIKSDNKIRFWAYNADNALDTSSTVTTSTWYNIVATYNNTSKIQTIYINGVLDNSNTHTQTFVLSTVSYLQIGGSQVLSGYLNGNISTIHIYNRALPSPEVLHNYNALKGRFGL